VPQATLAAVIALAMVALTGCAADTGPDADTGRPVFGTLVSLPEHSTDEARAGVRAAMVELSWKQFEPSPGQFDQDYIRSMQARVESLQSTGRTITLGLGMHDPPAWLLALPDSRFVDQSGEVSAEPNLVFNQQLRAEAQRYLGQVAAEFDLGDMEAIRLTSGGNSEVLYPSGGNYWAFDQNAQNGENLPPSMAPNPAPGWRPGDEGLTDAQVRQWADWYIGALADVVAWQINVLSQLGYHGRYQVVTPGSGVQPSDYEEALHQRLPPGLLGQGAAWQVFYRGLPRRADIVAYISSVADGSGGDDSCTLDDRMVALTAPETDRWSATRWISRLADEYGFGKSGENPGWHHPVSLDQSYRDLSSRGMMAAAVRQARSCGFESFYWAHDDQLWDGTVSFGHYAGYIRSEHG